MRTPGLQHSRRCPSAGEHTVEILLESGFSRDQVQSLLTSGAVAKKVEKAKL
eukprot:m.98045 g.98045  ORF g.98045 m.98045 type:complete len:52 (-) comp13622_c0_seq1:268-423(-)